MSIIEEQIREFEKRNVVSHPGDSGWNGNTPQEPVWEIQIEGPTDLRNELRRFASTLLDQIEREMGTLDTWTHTHKPKELVTDCIACARHNTLSAVHALIQRMKGEKV